MHETSGTVRHEVRIGEWVKQGNVLVCPLAYADGIVVLEFKPVAKSVRVRRKRRRVDRNGESC